MKGRHLCPTPRRTAAGSSMGMCLVLLCAALGACSGGGGTPPPVVAAWPKFRQNMNNSGAGIGAFASITPQPTPPSLAIDTNPIVSSPAIGLDGTVYVASEGGTLAAINPATFTVRASTTTCGACAGSDALGQLDSSPAVSTILTQTSVFIGSTASAAGSGRFYVFEDTGTAQLTCSGCFDPTVDPTIDGASFVSSPSFVVNSATGNAAAVFVGATLEVTGASGMHSVGKVYALNSDGSLKWQFPAPGAPDIGAVTASPALGEANTVYVTAADGNLYALTVDGQLRWTVPVGAASDSEAPFSASPAIDTLVYTATASGEILAVNPDGRSTHFRLGPDALGLDPADAAFVGSIAIGNPADTKTPALSPTPTQTPTATPGTPGPPQPTPTATPVFPLTTLFGVTKTGLVVAVDTTTGLHVEVFPTPTPSSATVVPPVLSSPALTNDGFLIFGDSGGRLHAVNTSDGTEPSGWPIALSAMPIRSSPAVNGNGSIFVGADDGRLYVVGAP